MKKELSIESIKKELIDRLVNNMDVLKYLEVDKNDTIKLSQVHNTVIYDYDNPNTADNYITVDVAEHVYSKTDIRDSKKYSVSIKTGLSRPCDLDKISATIKEIVLKEYPDIKAFQDVPIHVKRHTCPDIYREYDRINRMITFEIEESASAEQDAAITGHSK